MSTFRRCAVPLAVGIGATLGACGGSLCDRAQSVSNSLATKSQPCFGGSDAGVFFSQGMLNVNKAKCEANINQCSSSDKDALSKSLDCFDHVSTCSPATYFQFAAGLLACIPNMMQITPACLQALQQ